VALCAQGFPWLTFVEVSNNLLPSRVGVQGWACVMFRPLARLMNADLKITTDDMRRLLRLLREKESPQPPPIGWGEPDNPTRRRTSRLRAFLGTDS
jgi:hypothetical protein